MTDQHKKALAQGREQGRAVRLYLEALEQHRPRRGRKRTPESIKKRLVALDREIPSADPLRRVQLIQERINLEEELATRTAGSNLAELEKGFTKAAAEYSQRKGISYHAWRQAGVDAGVLGRAGISRSSS